jgi:hypothetical protein
VSDKYGLYGDEVVPEAERIADIKNSMIHIILLAEYDQSGDVFSKAEWAFLRSYVGRLPLCFAASLDVAHNLCLNATGWPFRG